MVRIRQQNWEAVFRILYDEVQDLLRLELTRSLLHEELDWADRVKLEDADHGWHDLIRNVADPLIRAHHDRKVVALLIHLIQESLECVSIVRQQLFNVFE